MWPFPKRREVVPPAPIVKNPEGPPRGSESHDIRSLREPRKPEDPTIPPFRGHPVDDPLLEEVIHLGEKKQAQRAVMDVAEELDELFERIQRPDTKPPRPGSTPNSRR